MAPSRRVPLRGLLCALVLSLAAGCGGDDPTTPTEFGVVFEPAERTLARGALQPVELRVKGLDGAPVSATFWLDGVAIATGSEYTWPADQPGSHALRATVEREGRLWEATWQVVVSDAGALPTPAVTELTATVGPLPGTITIGWEAPPASYYTIPLQDYLVGISTTPFATLEDAGVQTAVVAHQGASIVHQLEPAGLLERALYYVRLQVRDTFGRRSPMSPQVSSEATGHYDVRGTVYGMRFASLPSPLDAVLVAMGTPYRQLTAVDGQYALLNLPDIYESALSVRDTRLEFYSVTYPPLPPVDWDRDTVLFERGIVHVVNEAGEADWTRLAFLRDFTQRTGPAGNPIYRWANYPVAIHAAPFVNVYGVDYESSIRRAVGAWNAAAGAQLLVAVDTFNRVSDTGTYYVQDIPDGDGRIGETSIVDPSVPIRSGIPRLMRIRLVNFREQTTADRVIAHEVGHVLMLGHCAHMDYLMDSRAPVASGGVPHADEGFFARLLAHLPQGVDLAMYSDPPPLAPGPQ